MLIDQHESPIYHAIRSGTVDYQYTRLGKSIDASPKFVRDVFAAFLVKNDLNLSAKLVWQQKGLRFRSWKQMVESNKAGEEQWDREARTYDLES